ELPLFDVELVEDVVFAVRGEIAPFDSSDQFCGLLRSVREQAGDGFGMARIELRHRFIDIRADGAESHSQEAGVAAAGERCNALEGSVDAVEEGLLPRLRGKLRSEPVVGTG